MNIGISVIVCFVGAIVYLICNRTGPPELAELGRLAFFAGLLAILFAR